MTTHQAIHVHLSTHNPSFQGLLGGGRSGIRQQHNYWDILTYPIDELPPQTVMLYHKADWKDINQTITNTMTNHTLDIHTSTIQDIDNYVNTLADTITQTIDKRVQSKTLKPNSVGLPHAIRDLVKEKRRQRRYWQQTRQQHYKSNYNRLDRPIKQYTRHTRQNNWTKYCNDMELSEGHNDAWRKLRSVINPQETFRIPDTYND